MKTTDDEVLDLIKTWGDVPKILARLETTLHEHGQHGYSAYLGPIAGLRFIESCNTDDLGFFDVARREALEFTERVMEKLGGGMLQCGGFSYPYPAFPVGLPSRAADARRAPKTKSSSPRTATARSGGGYRCFISYISKVGNWPKRTGHPSRTAHDRVPGGRSSTDTDDGRRTVATRSTAKRTVASGAFAKQLGVDWTTLRAWESGLRKPNRAHARLIARILTGREPHY